jgi:3-hydroxymyristoyl/3-hydroxydecanoyl-(acyl carrier protein) dehydratase
VPSDLLHFQGHFEGWPVLPGVVQLGLIAVRHVELAWPSLGPLRRVRRLKMKQPITPDQLLVLELKRIAATDTGDQRVDFVISRDGSVCTSGSLSFAGAQAP